MCSPLPSWKELCASGEYADAFLVAEEAGGKSEELPCHALVLGRCEVLKRALEGPFEERASKRIRIPVVSATHLGAVKQFLYTDQMDLKEPWSSDDLVDIMALCDKYGLIRAVALVADEVCRRTAAESMDSMKQIATRMVASVGPDATDIICKVLVDMVRKKVEFGRDLADFLLWLPGLCLQRGEHVEKVEAACWQKLNRNPMGGFLVSMRKELSFLHQRRPDPAAARVSLLIIKKCMKDVLPLLRDRLTFPFRGSGPDVRPTNVQIAECMELAHEYMDDVLASMMSAPIHPKA